MFTKNDPAQFNPILPGIRLPHYAHPQEQTGYLLSGRMRLTIFAVHPKTSFLLSVLCGEILFVEPGDCWCIPAGVLHQAGVLQDSTAIEIFAPLREDYLPYYPA